VVKKYLFISSKTVLISLLSLAFSFLLLKIQLRFLGVEQRGVIILVQANVAVLISLFRFGIGQSVISYITKYDKSNVSSNFVLLTIIQAVIIGIIVLVLFKSTNFFGSHLENLSTIVIVLYSVSCLLFNAISNFSFLIHSSKIFATQTVMIGSLNVLFLLLISNLRQIDINLILLCITATQVCVLIFLVRLLPRFNLVFINKKTLRGLFFEGVSSVGWSFIKDLSYKIDLLIFGNTLSKYDFGIYSVLQNLCQSVWRVTDPLMASYSKYLMSIKKETYIKFTNNVILILIFLTIISLGMAYFLIAPIFGFIAGIDFSKFLIPSLILLYSTLIFNIWKLIANLFIQIRQHIPMYISLSILIVLFFSIKIFANSLNKAVVITSIVYSIVTLIMIIFYKRVNLIAASSK
jgi:O-antigen/teichoic acid export membrane protein